MAIRGVLIDLSGTLHVDDAVIPGCVEALRRLLSRREIGVRFVTNTTKKSRRALLEETPKCMHVRLTQMWIALVLQIVQLHAIGLRDVRAEHVVTSGGIARAMLEQRQLRPLLLVDDSLKEEFAGVRTEKPNAVVVGLAPDAFHYAKLNEAFRVLLDGGELIALHEARYYAVDDGLNIGPGAFVKALEFAAGVSASVIGKPSPQFFQQAVADMNVSAEDCVMIGDDVRQDVGGAMALGMRGVLVQTGKYRQGDEHSIETPPTFVAADFSAAVDWILAKQSSW